MRYYENLFIINPNFEADKISALIESVKTEITKLKGKTISAEDLGKRRLAYPIDKQKYGNYILVTFETENTSLIKELESWMVLNPGILSCMTVRLKKAPTQKTSRPVLAEEG